MICRICEKEIPDNSNYCPVCGTRQSRSHCINCGNSLQPDNTYCPNCGILVYKPSQSKTEQIQKRRRRRNTLGNLLLFLCFLAAVSLAVFLFFRNTQSAAPIPEPAASVSEEDFGLVYDPSFKLFYIHNAQEFVSKALLSPKSAQFAPYRDQEVSGKGDLVLVKGYVDSHNTYGTLVRSEYTVQLRILEGAYELVYMKVGEETTGTYIDMT